MATISVAVAIRDESEVWRKKQGDIIEIKPGGWQWGTGVGKISAGGNL